MENSNEEKLLTREEAMQLLNCKSVTFWRYTRENRFPYYRAGRKMLFKKSEILEAIRVK
jgi:excisionase family DNA binding protein